MEMLILLILSFLTSFVVVFLFTPSLIKIAKLKNLNDDPGGDRKLHKRKIPTIGGINIFAGTIFAFALWLPANNLLDVESMSTAVSDFKYVIATVIVLFFVGVKDDIVGTAPIKKLLAHIGVAMVLVLMANVRLKGLHGIFGVYEIPEWASVFISVFTIIVIVNAFNLIDGVDGLAAGIGLICSMAFGLWFFFAGNLTMAALAFSLAGSLIAFLFYNFSPARIFMGDSGSLTIGLIISILAIKLIEYDKNSIETILVHVSKPVFVIAVLVFPLYDTLRIFIFRTVKGVSPFVADRNHIHHRLLALGLNQRKTVILLYSINISLIAISILLNKVNPSIAFLIVGLVAVVVFQIPFLIKIKEKDK